MLNWTGSVFLQTVLHAILKVNYTFHLYIEPFHDKISNYDLCIGQMQILWYSVFGDFDV